MPRAVAREAPDEGAPPYTCADGYVRRSPEQTLYTPPDYRRRLLRRAAGLAAAVVLALAALWVLVHYSGLSIGESMTCNRGTRLRRNTFC